MNWIEIKTIEDFPDIDHVVLCSTLIGVYIAYRDSKYKWWTKRRKELHEVTHWLPLTDPYSGELL